MSNWKKVIIEGIIKIGLIFLLLLAYRSYGQMYRWQMDTFKNAEKSRKWRSKKKVSFLWTRSTKKNKKTKKFNYGKSTTSPRNSRGKR